VSTDDSPLSKSSFVPPKRESNSTVNEPIFLPKVALSRKGMPQIDLVKAEWKNVCHALIRHLPDDFSGAGRLSY
jgi:hypothetical protein